MLTDDERAERRRAGRSVYQQAKQRAYDEWAANGHEGPRPLVRWCFGLAADENGGLSTDYRVMRVQYYEYGLLMAAHSYVWDEYSKRYVAPAREPALYDDLPDEAKQGILGQWVPENFVFPIEFIHELLTAGRITDNEARGMVDAQYDRQGRVTVPRFSAGEVPEWALDEYCRWQISRSVPPDGQPLDKDDPAP